MASLRGAINAKCRECIYDKGAPGTWRAQVAGCTATSCPLYVVRPLPFANDDGTETEPAEEIEES